eukprot:m.38034 g.38034  ORF g.38034 m.38034 type:complete len:156 (+) comp11452_c0_seq2:212-679(+)
MTSFLHVGGYEYISVSLCDLPFQKHAPRHCSGKTVGFSQRKSISSCEVRSMLPNNLGRAVVAISKFAGVKTLRLLRRFRKSWRARFISVKYLPPNTMASSNMFFRKISQAPLSISKTSASTSVMPFSAAVTIVAALSLENVTGAGSARYSAVKAV